MDEDRWEREYRELRARQAQAGVRRLIRVVTPFCVTTR